MAKTARARKSKRAKNLPTFNLIEFRPKRRFGVELEFLSSTSREIARDCIERLGEKAEVAGYRRDTSTEFWTCKTDSSCGNEIASRVLGSGRSTDKCLQDIELVGQVGEALRKRGGDVDNSCGLHVHASVSDVVDSDERVQALLSYWIKFEYFIGNLVPEHRTKSQYCRFSSPGFKAGQVYTLRELKSQGFSGGDRKALSLTYLDERKTVEFRVAEGSLKGEDITNWVRFYLHFLECTKDAPLPEDLNFFDINDCFKFLGFFNDMDPDHKFTEEETFNILSPELEELRSWLLRRLVLNASYRSAESVKAKCKADLEFLGRGE